MLAHEGTRATGAGHDRIGQTVYTPAENKPMTSNLQFPATALRTRAGSDETLAAPREEPLPIHPENIRQAPSPKSIPAISVIIPVRNDPANLEFCLQALDASEHPNFEVIVVDDASTDATAEVARRHGAQLISLETQSGPAAARNRGARIAQHPYLFFIDADVCVQPATLGQMATQFVSDPAVDAFFGSYDASPGAPNLLSQYRNLLHHFVHQGGNEEAFSFWSGCGAIKKSVFLDMEGFDTGYDNASVEDIELGSRLRQAGHRIALVKSIQVKHMKRWTLKQMILTDIQKRAVPWTLLLLRQGKIPNDLNLRHSQRLSAVFAACLVATLAVGSWFHPSMLLLPCIPFVGMLLIDRWSMHRPVPKWGRIAVGLTTAVTAAALLAFTDVGPNLMQPWTLLALGFLGGIVLLNLRFYLFLLSAKRPLFVLLVMPVHVLYYLYSSLAFAIGLVLHLTRRGRQAQSTPD